MKLFALSRYSVSIAVAPALLAACGGMQPPMGAPNVIGEVPVHHQTFDYSGMERKFKVAADVKLMTVDARGATVGGSYSGNQGGLGGRVNAKLPVTRGETLGIHIGGSTDGARGGYNGGGLATSYQQLNAGWFGSAGSPC